MDIKKLIDDIEVMPKESHIEIFKIFRLYNVKFTENNNGIFFNMNNIDNYVNFINENNKDILEFEKVKEESKLKLLSIDDL